MKVECPFCNFVGNIDERTFTSDKLNMKCPKCLKQFELNTGGTSKPIEETTSSSLINGAEQNENINILSSHPAELNYALNLYSHKLLNRAKEELIVLIHEPKSVDEVLAAALFWLGQISFEEQNHGTAISDWEQLIKRFPESVYAKHTVNKVGLLKSMALKENNSHVESIVSDNFLKNGDFWAKNLTNFTIPIYTNLLNEKGQSFNWYDKIINYNPNSSMSDLAHFHKFLVHFSDAASWSSKHTSNSAIELYENYTNEFPCGKYLQIFSFLIAQGFTYSALKPLSENTYDQECANKAIDWLNKSLAHSQDSDDFYSVTATCYMSALLNYEKRCKNGYCPDCYSTYEFRTETKEMYCPFCANQK